MKTDLLRIVLYAALVAVVYIITPFRSTDDPIRWLWIGACTVAYILLAVWLVLLVAIQRIEMHQPRLAQAHKKRKGE